MVDKLVDRLGDDLVDTRRHLAKHPLQPTLSSVPIGQYVTPDKVLRQFRLEREGDMSDHGTQDSPAWAARPRLIDVAREAIRRRRYSYRTEETYLHWMKRFVLFSGKRHPRELGAAEVTAFSTISRSNVW
ncbi:MAG: phage integrase N-terminal SAM-like domain-containing protein [Burkholderiales bacterium]